MMTKQMGHGCSGAMMCTPYEKHSKLQKAQRGVVQMVGAIAFSAPLKLTVNDRQLQAGLSTGSPAQAENLQPYAQNGGITQSQIDNLSRSYAKRQSYKAIQSLRRRGELGSPNYVSEFREVYEIRGGDRYHAPQKFQILYHPSPSCNYRCSEAYDWYRQ